MMKSILLTALLICSVVATGAHAAVFVYESSTGNSNESGTAINSGQFLGSRFTLDTQTQVTGIGGAFKEDNSGPEPILPVTASILSMTGNLPAGSPFLGSEVLLSTTFEPLGVGDDIAPVDITLPAGDYALVFSTDIGGTSMDNNGTDTPEGTNSYFFWDGTSWIDGGFGNARFVVTTVPEPTSLALLGLGGLLVARRRK